MAKPLAGKAWFEAQGRRAASLGQPIIHGRLERQSWPMWARIAWARGWIVQPSPRQQTERIVRSFEDQALQQGKSLQAVVTEFLKDTP